MYGLLRGNGDLTELPDVVEASIKADVLICYDATGQEVARYPANGSLFGNVEVLEGLNEGDRIVSSSYETYNDVDQLKFSERIKGKQDRS